MKHSDKMKHKSQVSELFKTSSCLNMDQMIAYRDNKTSPEQRFEIEHHLADCEFCSGAMQGLLHISNTKRFRQTLHRIGNKIHKRFEQERTQTHPFRKRIMILSAAAALIVAVLSVRPLFIKTLTPDTLFDMYFTPYPNTVPLTRDATEASDLKIAMSVYERENYSEAFNSLENLLQIEPDYITARFYAGISGLCVNNSERALIHLKRVMQSEDVRFSDPAHWYRALALLKAGRIIEARSDFEKISQQNSDFSAQSLRILEHMKHIR
jgi:tetratricopeptide (TPR) repeat protein